MKAWGGTVTERIIALCDEQLGLMTEPSYRPEVKTRLAEIRAALKQLKNTCPHAWENAARILRGES